VRPECGPQDSILKVGPDLGIMDDGSGKRRFADSWQTLEGDDREDARVPGTQSSFEGGQQVLAAH
jgi:hypothetical protein